MFLILIALLLNYKDTGNLDCGAFAAAGIIEFFIELCYFLKYLVI